MMANEGGLWWGLREVDALRRWQGRFLDRYGLGPQPNPSRTALTLPGLQLLAYGRKESAPVLLLVPAPIKRAYIWDLYPEVSVVRRCLAHGLAVYLLEWRDVQDSGVGLADYADRLVASCLDAIAQETGERRVFIAGHSLGGTLAAIFAALHPEMIRGLVLLEAPLKFGEDAGPFGVPVALMPGSGMPQIPPRIPGSFLDLVGVAVAPRSFVQARWLDALSVVGSPRGMLLHLRVERWTLDELSMPGRLFAEVAQQLYREDRFFGGRLIVAGRRASPATLDMPLLAVLRPTSRIVPPRSIEPVLDLAPSRRKQQLLYAGDRGAALQHVGVLVGETAHRQVWPAILRWFDDCH
jgi:polyhydroxyalkanoate synthase